MPEILLASGSITLIIIQVIITMIITVSITRIFLSLWQKHSRNTIHRKFMGNIVSTIIAIIGTIVALNWIPAFSTIVTAILAGSGILALTIGLAAQESLGNFFNGFFMSVSRLFEVGDRIHLVNADITGFIEDISIRHTVIRTLTNSRIIVPNSIMNKELIENSNFCNPQAAAFIDVTITYDSDVEAACEIISRVISTHPDFIDTRSGQQKENSPEVPVLVRALSLYGIELRASMWTATIANNFSAASSVRMGILHEFNKAGVRIASSKIIDSFIQGDSK